MAISLNRFKYRLAKLIEISNEMVLNAADGELVRGTQDSRHPGSHIGRPGEIFYVFDESVFEFFVNTNDTRRKYPAFFHLEAWRDAEHHADGEEDYWKLINEMLSILTAEYLFSGKLPGQKKHIYMTYGHRYELGRSYQALIAGAQPPRASAAAHRAAMQEARELIEAVPATDDASDLRLVSDLRDVPKSDHASFMRVRRLARICALHKDHLVIPQLRRLSRNIWPQVHDITYQFPLTSADEQTIDHEAKAWEGRFSDYLKTRRRSERSDPGLRRDARALALVQHIARHHLEANERIVFVTGDRLMLEAYWLWYSEIYVRRPWEPNTIRSVGRFSPIVNLNDMLGSERREPAAFELMQVALNLAIQPWNMKAHEKLKSDPQRVANLWYLHRQILDSIQNPNVLADGFFDKVTLDKIDEIDREFEKIRVTLQTFERNATRVARELAEGRRAAVLAIHDPDTGDPGDEASAMEYFRGLTESLVQDNAKLCLPIVRDFLTQRGEHSGDRYLRPPITLLLRVRPAPASGGEAPPENVIDFERRLGEVTKEELQYLESSPHLIFVLGALYALRAHLWSDADLYAGMAKTAYRTTMAAGEAPADLEEDYQELRYLRAVCARMMLGVLRKQENDGAPGRSPQMHDVWMPYLERAERNLTDCIAFHKQHGHVLRQARALSERGSARLFYAVWSFADAPHLKTAETRSLADRFTEAVSRDLMEAFKLLDLIGDPPPEPDRQAMWTSTMVQVLVNVAAVEGICLRLPELASCAAELRAAMDDALMRAEQLLPSHPAEKLPAIVRREVVDFLTRRDVPVPDGWRAPGPSSLGIDRELLQIFARPIIN